MTTADQRDPHPIGDSELTQLLTEQAERAVIPAGLRHDVESRHRSIRRRRTISRAALASTGVGVVAMLFIGWLQISGSAVSDGGDVGEPTDLAAGPLSGFSLPADLTGVEDMGACSVDSATSDFVVWLNLDLDPETIDSIRNQLWAALPLGTVTYVDQEETYLEFRIYYADQPEVLELVEPEQLPTSFVVRAEGATAVEPIDLSRIAALPGVNQICSS